MEVSRGFRMTAAASSFQLVRSIGDFDESREIAFGQNDYFLPARDQFFCLDVLAASILASELCGVLIPDDKHIGFPSDRSGNSKAKLSGNCRCLSAGDFQSAGEDHDGAEKRGRPGLARRCVQQVGRLAFLPLSSNHQDQYRCVRWP